MVGAQLLVARSRRLDGPDETLIWNSLFFALIGAIVGARLAYVFGHFGEVTDGGSNLPGVFEVYKGGISLIGGIVGGILLALPYVRAKRLGFWRMMDLAAPGLALGIVIGRIGDLIIGDHLGKPTAFPLGWRCEGAVGQGPPLPASEYLDALHQGTPPSAGCYGLTLHETALYDFISTIALLCVLVAAGRVARNRGLLFLIFVLWYGMVRVVTDFLRVDRRYLGLTGSQSPP